MSRRARLCPGVSGDWQELSGEGESPEAFAESLDAFLSRLAGDGPMPSLDVPAFAHRLESLWISLRTQPIA